MYRDLSVTFAGEIDHAVPGVGVADVLEILVLIGGVHAQKIVVVRDLVHQDVVDKTAVLVEQSGIVRLADFQVSGVVGCDEID